MKRHFFSLVKSPLGYVANLLATVSVYVPTPPPVDRALCWACERVCLRDGVQDDMLF